MRVVYAQQSLFGNWPSSRIFLAGPTPRAGMTVPSWRPEAIGHLERLGYDGAVLVPEADDGVWRENYDAQVRWELDGIASATVVLFWCGFSLPDMPGFTTRTEFGMCLGTHPARMVVGIPEGAARASYIRWLAEHRRIPLANTLGETCKRAYHLARAMECVL